MTITHLSQLTHPLLRPTTEDLIDLSGWETFNQQDRWQIISLIEKRIDTLQGYYKVAKPAGLAQPQIVAKLKGLRMKRMQIWLSFHPNLAPLVRLAAV